MSRSVLWKLIAAVLIISALAAAVHFLPVASEFARFQRWVRAQGAAGYVIYALVYACSIVLLVPASILTVGAGAIFGVVAGTIVVICGATIGSTAAFLLARTALRKRVQAAVSKDARFAAVDRAIAREGTKIVFLIRLAVVFPFSYSNYALGLTGIRTVGYVLATFVGIAPGSLALVYIGAVAGQSAAAAGQVRLAVYVAGAGAALLASFVIGRIAIRQIRRAGVEEA